MNVSWPSVVWDASILRGLDARAHAELEAAGRLVAMRAGESLFAPGQPADALYVVARGAVLVSAVRRGDAVESVVRRVGVGEVFGEEAIAGSFATRQMAARAEGEAAVCEVPLAMFRRAVGRVGGAEITRRTERALRRAAVLDLLRSAEFTRPLTGADVEALVDASSHVELARGAYVYRAGEAAASAFVVGDGLVQVQTDDGDRPRVEAYLTRGDLFGDEELASRAARPVSVVASGPSWLVSLPREAFLRFGRGAPTATRVRLPLLPRPANATTAQVFADLYRMRVARSLLVIDQDSCVRCGHCAFACASTHADGVSRLVRQGDKIVVQREDAGDVAPLLVPNSCQHCKNPSCMIDCPTGAIGRDARGEVFIREDLCTGCGNCAKGCPWDNIQMAPRPAARAGSPDVAVKCDLCGTKASGPACVAVCPVEAIARVDPNEAFVELRQTANATPRGVLPGRRVTWPWSVGASLVAVALARLPLGKWPSGVVVGIGMLVVASYAVVKRRPTLGLAVFGKRRWAHAALVLHLTVGLLVAGVAAGHVGFTLPHDAAGALVVAVLAAVLSGVFGAAAFALVPARLARLERKSLLPEEIAPRNAELQDQIFAKLSGRTELVKTLYGKLLVPYRRRGWLGAAILVASGRSVREEEKRLVREAERLLGGKKSDRLTGWDELVRLVVERRALDAQRLLLPALRGFVYPHVAATLLVLLLTVVHVVLMTRRP